MTVPKIRRARKGETRCDECWRNARVLNERKRLEIWCLHYGPYMPVVRRDNTCDAAQRAGEIPMKEFEKVASEFFKPKLRVIFWLEDKVWNAECLDLSVAAFGLDLKSAMNNLRDAVLQHLKASSLYGRREADVENSE